ncbi:MULTISPECIES: TetR/AcrR family transcriptional regulator [unclassified Curtobacterium]|jgi:AcrR family transcriptional regulator|uniref:TetR/AcrR family transcriptional regulator n=1 Tax=unclassified Curtobacterium TaxID=257496 RepID=UPI002860D79E|nr:TetR/AcrR family transcriptional regulator [Curtobacterium sp. 320]MDR6573582.1 AcrR family transcriptional regulator [Curtobacterium sp. 320]
MVEANPGKRRRGTELVDAILEAAWVELVEVGYGRLTMDTIARRARTSEPVLYRRWPNKDALVVAAIEHRRVTHPVSVEDTGSLRGDLVAELTAAASARAEFYAITMAAAYAGLTVAGVRTPSEVRDRLMGPHRSGRDRPLYQRASDRGEIDLRATPDIVLEMPFALVRLDLLMNLAPPSAARVQAIVDDCFMPAIEHHRPH